jgi:hypothetical protein
MASLGEIYRDALLSKYEYPAGWLVNWPPSFDRRLGMVGTINDEMFNRSGDLPDYGVTAEPDPTPGRASGAWDFTSDNSIGVRIGADASAPGWSWIQNAKAGLKIEFSNQGGIVFAVGGTHQEALRDLDGLKTRLIDAAKARRMQEGHAVVIEQQVATAGLVISSEGRAGGLSATTNFDVGPAGTPSLFSFGADFHLHQKNQAISNQSFPNGFTVAFRIAKLGKRGWFWWRHWIVADKAVGADQEDELTDDDYFAQLS